MALFVSFWLVTEMPPLIQFPGVLREPGHPLQAQRDTRYPFADRLQMLDGHALQPQALEQRDAVLKFQQRHGDLGDKLTVASRPSMPLFGCYEERGVMLTAQELGQELFPTRSEPSSLVQQVFGII